MRLFEKDLGLYEDVYLQIILSTSTV